MIYSKWIKYKGYSQVFITRISDSSKRLSFYSQKTLRVLGWMLVEGIRKADIEQYSIARQHRNSSCNRLKVIIFIFIFRYIDRCA